MLHQRNTSNNNTDLIEPIFASSAEGKSIPKYALPHKAMEPQIAYRLIKDQLLDEGNSRQNLATFCQTYMEDEATKLLSETLDKNAIDKSEYPRTAELENRCVNIIADLWHAPARDNFIGTSTVGSSEACMLGGLAMKFKWRNQARKLGLNLSGQMPNLVISTGYQVCWEKFCVYFDVELRAVPMDEECMGLDPNKLTDYLDEYTIGVVGILGQTYTGKFDNMEEINNTLESYNATTDYKVYLHVDAASGGLFTPFIQPDLLWDFRLKNVVSINTSGHKYGLVYPGIGWIVWKDQQYVPQELIFNVSYLGGEMPTMAINFSRSASQIIGQYYNFLRLGFEGYQALHQRTKEVALYLAKELEQTKLFHIYNDGSTIPVVCYKLIDNAKVQWTLYDLTDRLLMKGWQVPTYPLPVHMDNIIVQRYVCRADFSKNMAESFIEDLKTAIHDLNQAHLLFPSTEEPSVRGFTH